MASVTGSWASMIVPVWAWAIELAFQSSTISLWQPLQLETEAMASLSLASTVSVVPSTSTTWKPRATNSTTVSGACTARSSLKPRTLRDCPPPRGKSWSIFACVSRTWPQAAWSAGGS